MPRLLPLTPRLAVVLSGLVIILSAAWLFAPALFQGQLLWGGDIEALEFALKTAARRSLAAGEWPLWMPELLGGMPGVAASNLIFLYPTELFMNLAGLPVHLAFGYDAFVQAFLSGLGTWLFLRSLGLSRGAALVGAAAFAWSGTQLSLLYAGHVNNTKGIAMIPWAFWGVHAGMKGFKPLAWALCGAALALQVLGMGLQIYAYAILAVAAFAFWQAWSKTREGDSVGRRRLWVYAIGGLAIAAVFSTLLAAPQLIPSLQYKGFSWRQDFSYESFISWSFHPKELISYIVPGFYGWRHPTYVGDWPFCLTTEYLGLLPWALAAAAVAVFWKDKRGPVRFFIFLAVASFLIGIGKWTPIHHVFYKLPIYSGFRTWARFLCLMTFSVAVLSAYGWQALVEEKNRRARLAVYGVAGLAVLVALLSLSKAPGMGAEYAQRLAQQGSSAAALVKSIRDSASHALFFALALAVLAWLVPKTAASRGLALALLPLALALHWIDMGPTHQRYLVFKNPAEITTPPAWLDSVPPAQAEPYRVYDLPGLWAQNRSVYYGYENLMGYHGVQMASQRSLLEALKNRQAQLFDLMNVRYLFSKDALGLPGWKTLSEKGAYVYENPTVLPRAFLVGKSRVVDSQQAAFDTLGRADFNPRAEVVLENGPVMGGGPAAGSVKWLKRSPNAFELRVQVASDGLLVVSNSWYPGWTATVDGKVSEILRANGALQAIRMPAGDHLVHFRFTSPMFRLGGWMLALGLLGLAALGWQARRRRETGGLSPEAGNTV